MNMRRFFIHLAAVTGVLALAACEATPVLDPANYYPEARYYDGQLITDRRN